MASRSDPRIDCERLLTELTGRAYALLVCSGTVALELALEACLVAPGKEVIVPSLTWQADLTAVQQLAARPILVDVEPTTLTLDPRAAVSALTPDTMAVILVHLYSSFCAPTAEPWPISAIEDASHLLGSTTLDGPVGSFGAISVASFQSSKVFAAGEGGVVLADDPVVAARVSSLRDCGRVAHGLPKSEAWQGLNRRISKAQAAILLRKLRSARRRSLEVSATIATLMDELENLGPTRVVVHERASPLNGATLLPYYLALRPPTDWTNAEIAASQHALDSHLAMQMMPPYPALPDDETLNASSRPFFRGLRDHGLSTAPVIHSREAAQRYGGRLLMIHHSRLTSAWRSRLGEGVRAVLSRPRTAGD